MNFKSIPFDESLPITQKRQEIAELITNHPVVVIAGETGSGKTTQIPKICLSLGLGERGMIGHTQPRRIAARTVANRIAEELKTPLGQTVGYKIRFTDKTESKTAIKVMTDGILLAEIKTDPWLKLYSTLIIDEAHERSLNIDLILGYLKYLLSKRRDLKIIITSATIDPEKFSKFFNQAPMIEVSGRTYPVDVWYSPLAGDAEEKSLHQIDGILKAVEDVTRVGRGDILVFLSGEREIRETTEALRKHHLPHTEILPLYARLSVGQQHQVFEPSINRRIILATNVAETSLTVPGIQFVIDTGVARISRYNYRNQVQRLPIEPISKASANQRKGRCGRVMAGVCVRLYEEDDFLTRPDYTEPEILRTPLAGVILHMLAVGLGEIEKFPFLDPPDIRHIREGFKLLEQLGALTPERTLTPLGLQLSQFSIDPILGTIILSAAKYGCLAEILIIVSALSIQDPRERPSEYQKDADEKHSQYKDPRSDFLAYLRLWETVHKEKSELSNNQFKNWCRKEFLSFIRLQDWREVHQQLNMLVTDMGFRINKSPALYEQIHCALLAGLISNIGFHTEKNLYLGIRNTKFSIFPGSVLFAKPPRWLLAFEIVETQRLYARTNARLLPEWIETVAGHLFKVHYDNPHWERKIKQVMAISKANLYGLMIYENRKVVYGQLDPKLSRTIFIRSALVEGEYDTRATFFHHNRALIESVEILEHKARRRDILIDEQDLYEFYEQKIPEGIVSGPAFEQWLKTIDQKSLMLTESALIRRSTESITEIQYPGHILIKGMTLTFRYHFEPGTPEDGVTVTVPMLAIKQLSDKPFEWLVPGLLKEKVAALIKSLPKHLRRNFVPLPEYSQAIANRLMAMFREGDLKERLATELFQVSGIKVSKNDFVDSLVPEHLKMRFCIIDSEGKLIESGRILDKLKGIIVDKKIDQSISQTIQNKLTDWPKEDIPEQVERQQNGKNDIYIPGYPALVDKKDYVSLEVMSTEAEAQLAHLLGVRRLLYLSEEPRLKYLTKQLSSLNTLALQFNPLGTKSDLLNDFLMSAIDKSYLEPFIELKNTGFIDVRKKFLTLSQYQHCMELGRPKLLTTAHEISIILGLILANYQKIKSMALGADLKEQLDYLIYPGFLTNTPMVWLKRMPVYLQAMEYRIQKGRESIRKDEELEKQIKPFWQRYLKLKLNQNETDVVLFRWMIEEFRVSLFAQHLKTIMPISAKRLDAQWQTVVTKYQ